MWNRPASPLPGIVQAGGRSQMDQWLAEAAEVQAAVLLSNHLEPQCALVVVGHDLHVADLEHHGAHGEVGRKKILAGGFCSH